MKKEKRAGKNDYIKEKITKSEELDSFFRC
jgi:hypothetical protein